MVFKDLVFSEDYYLKEYLKEYIQEHKFFNENVTEYLNKFCKSYNISINNSRKKELIVITYWDSALILYKHHRNETGWSSSSINDYINVVRKILELLLYVSHVDAEKLNNIYLEYDVHSNEYEHYYFFLNQLSTNYMKDTFEIIDGKYHNVKSNRNFVCLLKSNASKNIIENIYVYHPIGNHNLKGPTKEISHIEYYFKTTKDKSNVVYRIFSLDESQGRRSIKNKGGLRGKAIPLETFQIVDYITPVEESDDISEDTIKEIPLLSRQEALSPNLDPKIANLVNNEFYRVAKKNSVEANYKQHLINTAITNSYIYKNINLETSYSIPSFLIFKDFIKYLMKHWNDDYFRDIIIFSTILGISIEKLIYSILNFDDVFSYKKVTKKYSKLIIKINNKYFADYIDTTEKQLSYKTEKEGEIYLIESLEKKWINLKDNLEQIIISRMNDDDILVLLKKNSNHNFKISENSIKNYVKKCKELNEFNEIKRYVSISFTKEEIQDISELGIVEFYVNELIKNNLKTYNNFVKEFGKNIKINFKNIHTLFYYYFQIYNSVSDIHLLFTRNISKNDEARLTYCSSTKRLITYETWLYNFIVHLGLDNYFNNEPSEYKLTELDHSYKIGSKNYIKPSKFKEFIINLHRLDISDEIDKINILMIYLRYSFSLLLVSRDFKKTSSNLSQVSKRFKVITIQEKGKNVYKGKRIIPLTDRAITCINMFKKIKYKYRISNDSPVLIYKKNDQLVEEEITQSTVNKYLKSLMNIKATPFLKVEKKAIIESIMKFTLYTSMNFGRHVVTSIMVQRGICSEYIDAIMNHHQLGKEDQGKYSNFNTLEYIDKTRDVLEEVEKNIFLVRLT